MVGAARGADWEQVAAEVLVGMREWRQQHPRASLTEIEQALDERWSRLRVRMLEDLAHSSALADLPALAPEQRPACPACGTRLEAHGRETRELTTYHDRTLRLERSYAVCPSCGMGLSPPG